MRVFFIILHHLIFIASSWHLSWTINVSHTLSSPSISGVFWATSSFLSTILSLSLLSFFCTLASSLCRPRAHLFWSSCTVCPCSQCFWQKWRAAVLLVNSFTICTTLSSKINLIYWESMFLVLKLWCDTRKEYCVHFEWTKERIEKKQKSFYYDLNLI